MDVKDSILLSVKQMLGIDENEKAFDNDIIMHINSAIFKLRQFGIGPKEGYMIADDTQTYSDYLGDDRMYQSVKMYLFLNTKLIFDSSSLSGAVVGAIKEQILELETRFLYLQSEKEVANNG